MLGGHDSGLTLSRESRVDRFRYHDSWVCPCLMVECGDAGYGERTMSEWFGGQQSPYGGSAPHYRRGRLPYPLGVADTILRVAGRDGQGRLLDVGCGPGTVALSLAEYFDEVVGVDADEAMIDEAQRTAAVAGLSNSRFVCMRAEQLPAELGCFRVGVFAQSFHWLDGDRVAGAVMRMLEPGGLCVLIYAWTLRGDGVADSRNPLPPYEEMAELVSRHRGAAGTPSVAPGDEVEALNAVGFLGPEVVTVSGGLVVTTTVDDLVSRYLSTSGAAPHLLGHRLADLQHDARELLRAASPSGYFAERLRDAQLNIWTKQARP
jgi:SAM-dependent methyltransferase